MTYKGLVDRIEDAVTRHKMLVDFGYGQLSDIKVLDNSEDGADYPYAFLLPTGITRAQQAVTYSFSLIVMEMALNPREVLTVQSNCIQYINDLISDLRFDTGFGGDVNLSQSVQVFRERFQDEVAGATLNLQVTVADPIDNCTAPLDPRAELIVHASNLNVQTIGNEVGENKAFTFDTEILDEDDQWRFGNRFTSNVDGTFNFEMEYRFSFVTDGAATTFPSKPRLIQFSPAQTGIEATTTTGWPTNPTLGEVYTIKQVWKDIELLADTEFVVAYTGQDQIGIEEYDMEVYNNAFIKIFKQV